MSEITGGAETAAMTSVSAAAVIVPSRALTARISHTQPTPASTHTNEAGSAT